MTDKEKIQLLEEDNRQLLRTVSGLHKFLDEALKHKNIALSLLSRKNRARYFEIILAEFKGE